MKLLFDVFEQRHSYFTADLLQGDTSAAPNGLGDHLCRFPFTVPKRHGIREACELLLDEKELAQGRTILEQACLLPWEGLKQDSKAPTLVVRGLKKLYGFVYPAGERVPRLRHLVWQTPLVIEGTAGDLMRALCRHKVLRQDIFALCAAIVAQSYAESVKHKK